MYNPETIFITIISFLLFVIFIPTLTGIYLTRRIKLPQNFYICYPLGTIFLWACSQLILVPLIMIRASFYLALLLIAALYITGGLIGFLQYCIIANPFQKTPEGFSFDWRAFLKKHRPRNVIVFGTTCLAVILVFIYQGTAYCDVHYIVSAADMLKSGRMFLSNPASGAVQQYFTTTYLADLTSPWAFQYAFLGAVTLTRPIAAAHIMLPVQIVVLCSCLYYLLSEKYSPKDSRIRHAFFIIMWVIQILGYYSSFCSEAYLMTKTWLPEAALSSAGILLIIYIFSCIDDGQEQYFYCLPAANLSLCYMHRFGMIAGLLFCLSFGICYAVRKKSSRLIKWTLLSVVPNCVYIAVTYNNGGFGIRTGYGTVFEKIVNSFRIYTGDQLMVLLGIISLVIICVTSRSLSNRLAYPILLTLVLAFALLLAGLLPFDMATAGIFWLFPEALLISTAFPRFISRSQGRENHIFACLILVLILLIAGNFFVPAGKMHILENLEKTDQKCKKVYDHILDHDATPSCIFCDDYIWAARQYSGNFIMPYAYNEDGSLTFAHAHDQSLPHMMTRLFELSYFICENASQNDINYIVVKADHHLQIRYLKSHHFYVSARIGDTIIYAYTPPSQVKKLDYISKQLNLGRSGFFRALRQIDSKRLSKYDEQEKKDRRRRKEQKDKKRN